MYKEYVIEKHMNPMVGMDQNLQIRGTGVVGEKTATLCESLRGSSPFEAEPSFSQSKKRLRRKGVCRSLTMNFITYN